jgi:tetratricopeptide (TPR) repeat protein
MNRWLRRGLILGGLTVGGAAVAVGLTDGPQPILEPQIEAAIPDTPAFLAGLPTGRVAADADKAVATWAARARLTPDSAGAWTELADALMQKARETADASYYAHADRAYAKALELEPNSGTALAGRAWVAGCRHEFEQSAAWAEKAIAAAPDQPAAHGLLGDARMEMGDYEAAGEHYQKMLDLRPDQSSYSRGAVWLFATGDVRKATWLMGKAAGAGSPYAENTAWCRAQLALMHFHTGALLPAEQLVEQALTETPANVHLLAVAGRVKAARGDYPAAIELYRKAAAVAPQHDTLVALADLYRLTGKPADAEEQDALVEATHRLNQASGVRGDSQLARFYADRGRNLQEALALAEEEYKSRKTIAVADTLAWCLYKNGRLEEARKAAEKALRYKTPDASIRFHAGMIAAKLGDRPQAQLHLYQALSLNPHFHPIDAKTAADTLAELGSTPLEAKEP